MSNSNSTTIKQTHLATIWPAALRNYSADPDAAWNKDMTVQMLDNSYKNVPLSQVFAVKTTSSAASQIALPPEGMRGAFTAWRNIICSGKLKLAQPKRLQDEAVGTQKAMHQVFRKKEGMENEATIELCGRDLSRTPQEDYRIITGELFSFLTDETVKGFRLSSLGIHEHQVRATLPTYLAMGDEVRYPIPRNELELKWRAFQTNTRSVDIYTIKAFLNFLTKPEYRKWRASVVERFGSSQASASASSSASSGASSSGSAAIAPPAPTAEQIRKAAEAEAARAAAKAAAQKAAEAERARRAAEAERARIEFEERAARAARERAEAARRIADQKAAKQLADEKTKAVAAAAEERARKAEEEVANFPDSPPMSSPPASAALPSLYATVPPVAPKPVRRARRVVRTPTSVDAMVEDGAGSAGGAVGSKRKIECVGDLLSEFKAGKVAAKTAIGDGMEHIYRCTSDGVTIETRRRCSGKSLGGLDTYAFVSSGSAVGNLLKTPKDLKLRSEMDIKRAFDKALA